jgi:hypothetical protein
MKPKRLIRLAVVLVLTWTAASAAYDVPDLVRLSRIPERDPLSSWVGDVSFPHGEHATRENCIICHHKQSAKELGEYVPCRQCHSGADPLDPTGFFQAWHAEGSQSCLGCHQKKRYRDAALPPLGCTTGCHEKKG